MIEVGTIVRATYPNTRWGQGIVVDASDDTFVTNDRGRRERRKPYVVMRDDGTYGYFHEGQIEAVVCVENRNLSDAWSGTCVTDDELAEERDALTDDERAILDALPKEEA